MKNKYEVRGDVTAIYLKRMNGTVIETIIDTEDLERVSFFHTTWVAQYNISTKKFYVKTSFGGIKNRSVIHLHRFISNCPKDLVPDHFNWNPLDNRKSNLRNITQEDNLRHKERNENNCVYKVGNKFTAHVRIVGKQTYIGTFLTKAEAMDSIKKYRDFGTFSKKIDRRAKGSVSWQKKREKWRVCVTIDGKQKYIGSFVKKDDAENTLKNVLSVV